jgi:hypothetical protein
MSENVFIMELFPVPTQMAAAAYAATGFPRTHCSTYRTFENLD